MNLDKTLIFLSSFPSFHLAKLYSFIVDFGIELLFYFWHLEHQIDRQKFQLGLSKNAVETVMRYSWPAIINYNQSSARRRDSQVHRQKPGKWIINYDIAPVGTGTWSIHKRGRNIKREKGSNTEILKAKIFTNRFIKIVKYLYLISYHVNLTRICQYKFYLYIETARILFAHINAVNHLTSGS